MAAGFDPEYYVERVGKSDFGEMSPAEHFHRVGWKLGIDPTNWFSTKGYLERYPDVEESGENPFVHYALYGKREGRMPGKEQVVRLTPAPNDNVKTTPNSVSSASDRNSIERDEVSDLIARSFDLSFYRAQLGISELSLVDAVTHYSSSGWKDGLDPVPHFSTRQYLMEHRDVAEAGINPYFHFLKQGTTENRRARQSDFRHGLREGDGKSEWVGYSAISDRSAAAKRAARPKMGVLDFTVALAGTDLAQEVLACRLAVPYAKKGKKPELSVVIPCWEEAEVTAECLVSLFRCSGECSLEIILVNNGSVDPFFEAIRKHPDISRVDFAENVGFGPAHNAGVKKARGKYVLLLNNDTQIAPGSLRAMLDRFSDDPTAGVVGPKIVSFDGRLQEAGALIKADGTGQFVGFAADPDEPRFNYARQVEHLSAAGIMISRELFDELGGFDEAFAPAYCEDADLSLRVRREGYALVYEPAAVIAHHLSRTTNGNKPKKAAFEKHKLVTRNRARLIERWANELTTFDIRTIAFYLPQYHPIPENDLWWGKGFTEWRNLSTASPKFLGHRQPRRPADLGYYDLRVPEIMEEQAALARRYGISGFCYYYYRFGDQRLLERPLERMLETGNPDIPFCLCWANENWSRRWDGNDQDILMEQKYRESDAVAFAEDIARYFANGNYITVNEKPLILFYRLQEIPNPKRYVAVCRNVWKRLGFADVMVAMVESFELSAAPRNPEQFGADITVEFPAHGMVHDAPLPVRRSDKEWAGNAHDYKELAGAFIKREEAGFKRFRSVLVGWDTTPRHPTRSLVLENSTPGAFQAWLEWTYHRTREQNFGDERIVFINAWNEWCEGSYLEPDTDYGHAYLQAVKNAQESVALGSKCFVEVA